MRKHNRFYRHRKPADHRGFLNTALVAGIIFSALCFGISFNLNRASKLPDLSFMVARAAKQASSTPVAKQSDKTPPVAEVKAIKLISSNPTNEVKIWNAAEKACKKHQLGETCIKDLVAMALTEKRDLDCTGYGDNGHALGCYQINDVYHPEISDSLRQNIEFSVNWTLDRMIYYGYKEKRDYAVMKHNGTPYKEKTLAYLATVNEFVNKQK